MWWCAEIYCYHSQRAGLSSSYLMLVTRPPSGCPLPSLLPEHHTLFALLLLFLSFHGHTCCLLALSAAASGVPFPPDFSSLCTLPPR